mmetsp:Transcript_31552/g.23401  ORF Transcript_31552/g.23401 Transcript_31552/m.23401 type:complete len:97 (+) Transcript_31552:155-445(+)
MAPNVQQVFPVVLEKDIETNKESSIKQMMFESFDYSKEFDSQNYFKIMKRALKEVIDQNELLRKRVRDLEIENEKKDKAIVELFLALDGMHSSKIS